MESNSTKKRLRNFEQLLKVRTDALRMREEPSWRKSHTAQPGGRGGSSTPCQEVTDIRAIRCQRV